MRKMFWALAVLLLLPGLTFAAAPAKRAVTATVDSDGVQRVEMVGGSYFFDPYQVTVKVNIPVELKVRKESGVVPHDIVAKSPEAGIEFAVALLTEPRTIIFTPTKTGSYPFYCSKKLLFLESHHDKGMEGMLEVVQ